MKFIVVALVVLWGVWFWRRNRQQARGDTGTNTSQEAAGAPPAEPTPVISCVQCGVHVPEQDAIKGRLGLYCSESHRLNRES